MLRNSILAAVAASTMVMGMAALPTDADARHRDSHRHHHRDSGIFLGFPFFFGDFGYSGGYYHRDRDCHWVKVKRKHHKARWVKRCHYHSW